MGVRGTMTDDEELADVAPHPCRSSASSSTGGLAGHLLPQGLRGPRPHPGPPAEAFNEEIVGYDYPVRTQVPTFTPCGAVILEFGHRGAKAAATSPPS